MRQVQTVKMSNYQSARTIKKQEHNTYQAMLQQYISVVIHDSSQT